MLIDIIGHPVLRLTQNQPRRSNLREGSGVRGILNSSFLNEGPNEDTKKVVSQDEPTT